MMLILKLVLFAILTAIPFLYHFLVKPRRESVKRYRNAFTAAQPQLSRLKKLVWRIGTYAINFHDKMKRRKNPRKLFTLILLLFLIGVQCVDNLASGEVASIYKTMSKENRLEKLSVSGRKTAAPFMQRKMINCLYPFLTRPLIYLLTLGLTLLFFAYKTADKILTKIHNSKKVLIGVSCLVVFFSFFDEGRYMLLSEVLFIVMLAALFYPNFHGHADPKGRKPLPCERIKYRHAA